MRTSLVRLLPLLLAPACASGEKPVHERGWVGGEVVPVAAPLFGAGGTQLRADGILGMPEGVDQTRAALLVDVGAPDSPWARSGLRAGDLLLQVGEDVVSDGEDLADRVRDAAPGSTVPIRYWRDGGVEDGDLTVGTEAYRRHGSFSLGLGLAFELDLWPFDDGINLLGLVVAEPGAPAPDLTGVEHDYAASVAPEVRVAPSGGWRVFLGVIGVGAHDEVLSQTSAGPGGE